MRWVLPARQPFCFETVLRSHGWAQLAPFYLSEEPWALERVLYADPGLAMVARLTAAVEGVAVETTRFLDQQQRESISAQARWMLGLDQDLSAFYALAAQEPKLARVQREAQGRLLRSPTMFEDIIKVILTTNTAWGGTRRMNDALVEQFGTPAQDDPTRRAFPTPAQLAAADEDTLRTQTRLGYRAPYILALARDVDSGKRDLEALKSSDFPSEALRKRLLAIKGVGPYAVAHLLMFLERYDQLPIDSWATKLVAHEWHHDQPVTPAQVKQHFAAWGQWAGLVYWLWDWDWWREEASLS